MTKQLDQFNARVKRINDPRNKGYVDPETGIVIPKRLSRNMIKTGNRVSVQKAGLGSILLSLILGAGCIVGARYIRFELVGIEELGTDPTSLLAMDVGLAAVIVFVLGGILKHKSLRHMTAQVAGIFALAVSMHNLVWMLPSESAEIFSSAYVTQVQQQTEPMSIYLNGKTVFAL